MLPVNKSIRVSGIEIKKVVEDIIDENEIIIIKNCEEFPIQAVIAFTIAVESRSNKQLIFVSEKREYRLATNKALSDRIVILSQ